MKRKRRKRRKGKKTDATITTAVASPLARALGAVPDEFIPFPEGRLDYRGLKLSRGALRRLADAGEIKTKEIRIPPAVRGRVYIIRGSLDDWIDRQ
jgi:hypothetical protein